jgi:TP901 family phage tail tape measure protein
MLIDRLHYALGLDTSELKSGVLNAHSLMGGLDRKMAGMAKGAGIAAIALALGKIGIEATKMAAELNAAMGEVWSITDKTREEMEGLTQNIIDLSRRTPEVAPALAKAYYQVLSAGITDTTEALEVLEVSSKGATAGLTSTFTVVDAITNILNAYNREASESAEISDDLFTAVRDGKVTMEQLAPAIGAVVGTASLAKVELKEVLAAIVAMTLSGYSVDESVTSINRLLLSIVDTQDSAKEAAKTVGIEWSVAGLRAKGFQKFIQELNDKAGDNIELLQAIVPEVRAFRAAAVIAGTGAENYARSLNNLKNSAGATEQALSKILEDPKKQWQIQKNRFNAALIELGYKILPAVKLALQGVNDLFEKVGLTGSTAAERLKTEWAGVAASISGVSDLTSRIGVLQKALTLLLTPGPDTAKNLEEVRKLFLAFPAMSAEAKAVQGYRETSSADLLSALHAELDYLKKSAEEAKKIGLEEKQRIITVSELHKYQQQITSLQKQAKALGMTEEYNRLAGIMEGLKASEQQWTAEKRAGIVAMNRGATEQLVLAKAFEAAGENEKNLKRELLDDTQKLMVSDVKIAELEKLKATLGKASAEAAQKAAEARADELKALEAMERLKPAGGYQWMPQSTITQTSLIPTMPSPKTAPVKEFNNELSRLWNTFAYGEDAAQNFTAAGMKLVDTFLEGNQQARQFASGVIQFAEGLATHNPLSVFEGLVDVFAGLFSSGSKAADSTMSLTERIEAYTEQLREMSYLQIQGQITTLENWYRSLSGIEKTAYKKFYEETIGILNDQLANFGKWGDDFASMIERWNYEVRVLNIEDPAEKFKMLVRYAKQYLGIDLPTEVEDGLAKIRLFLESLGTGANIKDAWQAAFGMAMPTSLSEEQLRELVEAYSEALIAMQEAAEETASSTTKTEKESVTFTKTKQITYRQADEMILALWSIDDYARKMLKVLTDRLTGYSAGNVTLPVGTEVKIDISDLISRLNIYATNVIISSQNCIVDVSKAEVFLSGATFNPATYSSLITNESTRVLRSQGLAWAT